MRWTGWAIAVASAGALIWAPPAGALPGPSTEPGLAPNGPVHAMARAPDGRLYIGGEFTRIAPPTGSFAVVSATTAQRDAAFPRVDGEINAITADGAGGWFIGGRFSKVGDVALVNAAHVRADKTVDPAWKPNPSGLSAGTQPGPVEVLAIAVSGSTVYLGGNFATVTQAGGGGTVGRVDAAAVDTVNGFATGWNPNPAGSLGGVRALAVSGSTVYMGGHFGTVTQAGGGGTVGAEQCGGRRRHERVRDRVGSQPQHGSPNDTVNALAVSGGTVYLGG